VTTGSGGTIASEIDEHERAGDTVRCLVIIDELSRGPPSIAGVEVTDTATLDVDSVVDSFAVAAHTTAVMLVCDNTTLACCSGEVVRGFGGVCVREGGAAGTTATLLDTAAPAGAVDVDGGVVSRSGRT